MMRAAIIAGASVTAAPAAARTFSRHTVPAFQVAVGRGDRSSRRRTPKVPVAGGQVVARNMVSKILSDKPHRRRRRCRRRHHHHCHRQNRRLRTFVAVPPSHRRCRDLF